MIQIYCGDGKGKTSAAVGAAVRFAGTGGKVLFYQFMKNQRSSERKVLSLIPEIYVMDGYSMPKFSFKMSKDEKSAAGEAFRNDFLSICREVKKGEYGMIILDEMVSCLNAGFLDERVVYEFLDEYSGSAEIIITGREPSERLVNAAGYISEVKKIRHPYDSGTAARYGIEY